MSLYVFSSYKCVIICVLSSVNSLGTSEDDARGLLIDKQELVALFSRSVGLFQLKEIDLFSKRPILNSNR